MDCDGKQEEISKLNAGCGYLALDKNGDGVINDGNELFGVKTGDGFYELSKYDSDLNGWIDETTRFSVDYRFGLRIRMVMTSAIVYKKKESEPSACIKLRLIFH